MATETRSRGLKRLKEGEEGGEEGEEGCGRMTYELSLAILQLDSETVRVSE